MSSQVWRQPPNELTCLNGVKSLSGLKPCTFGLGISLPVNRNAYDDLLANLTKSGKLP